MSAHYAVNSLKEKYLFHPTVRTKGSKDNLGGLYITDKASGRIRKVAARTEHHVSKRNDHSLHSSVS